MKKLLSCVVMVLFAVGLVALSTPGYAGEAEATITMEETVVTATRDIEEIRKVPANVTVITAEEIKKSGATNIVEVLENLEGIRFRTFSGNSSQAQIDMRGFGDNGFGKTLIMLDGRRLNRPDMASVNCLQIPLNNIEKIEIVRGAGSVLYGDSAVAGVINIITKRGVGKPKVNASVIAGSYGLHDERVDITGSEDRLSYAMTGENQKTFGYRARSKFSSRGAGINLGYDASDALSIGLGLSFNEVDYDLPGSLTKAEMEQDRRQYQPARGWESAHANNDSSEKYYDANLRVESSLGNLGRCGVDFLYGSKDIKNNMESFWPPNRYNVADIDTFGITPKYILEKDVFKHTNKLILGLDYYRETLNIDKYSNRERTLKSHIVDLERNSLGYYVRNEFNILEDLILSAGYRTERATIKGNETTLTTQTIDFDSKKIHKGEAYEAGLTYLIGEKSKIFGKYARVYRYPFLDEQGSYWGFGADAFYTDIEAEKGKSYEVGTQFCPMENLKIGLTLFRINMEDEITWNNVTFRNENLDKTRHEGVEIAVSYKVEDRARFYGNFTYQEAKFREGTNEDKDIPLVPRKMANIGMELYLPYSLVICPEMRFVGKSYLGNDRDNSSEQLEEYTIYDLLLFYRPETGWLKFSAFFGVENMTDEKYSTMGYEGGAWSPDVYYPSAGVTIKGGISFAF